MMKLNKNLFMSIITWFVVGICILLLIFLLIDAIGKDAHAAELELKTGVQNFNNGDVEGSPFAELQYRPRFSGPFYGTLQYSAPTITYVGQKISRLDLIGAGIGVKKPVYDGFNIGLELLYFQPIAHNGIGTNDNGRLGDMAEALYIYARQHYGDRLFDRYEYEIEGNLGGKIYVEYQHDFNNHWSLDLGLGYTRLTLHERMSMYDTQGPGSGEFWTFPGDRDMSHWTIGGGIKFVF